MKFFKCINLPDMYLCMSGCGGNYGGNVRAFKKDLSLIYMEELLTAEELKDKFSRWCYALRDNTRANNLCSKIASNNQSGNSSTPEGNYKEYYLYKLN